MALTEKELFDRMVEASEQTVKEMEGILVCRSCKVGEEVKQDVGEYSMKVCLDRLEALVNDLEEYEIPNEDWNWLSGKEKPVMYEYNRQPLTMNAVRGTLKEILDRDVEAGEYECENQWGTLKRVPYSEKMKNLGQGQRIAESMWQELMEGPKHEALQQLADEDTRKKETEKCKCAVKSFAEKYYSEMEKRIPELR